jgi:hypothetical protein
MDSIFPNILLNKEPKKKKTKQKSIKMPNKIARKYQKYTRFYSASIERFAQNYKKITENLKSSIEYMITFDKKTLH